MYLKKVYPTISDDTYRQLQKMLSLNKKLGVYSGNCMAAAGFNYTGDRDAARCKECGLEISNWTLDMEPFSIHLKERPDCSFIQSRKASILLHNLASSLPTIAVWNTLKSIEIDEIKQIRRRTFSHWPHRIVPSSTQMIESGFFSCNVGDRVICVYCNLICQQWTPHIDDPCEVHKTLSPNCFYVKAKLTRPSALPIRIINETLTGVLSSNPSSTSTNLEPLRSDEIVLTITSNSPYAALPTRHASFATWPNENLPLVDDLVRAGFVYTGTKTIVTCFYCNGSLQNWGPNDNPMIEHTRWFPHCGYIQQLCGDVVYQNIQESKRVEQERVRTDEARKKTNSGSMGNTNRTTNNRQLLTPDESTLSRLVAARLDLPESQRLLDQNFTLSIIKRCWEDQLRLKQDDFVSKSDLFFACFILQKQIEHIAGKGENIIIPSIKMKQIKEENAMGVHQQSSATNHSMSNTTSTVRVTSTYEIAPRTNNDQINVQIQYNSIPPFFD